MKKYTLFLCSILFSSILFSSNSRYRLILTDDPATTIMIGWEQVSGTSPTVYYGTIDNGTSWGNYPNSKTIDRSISYKGMNNNFAKLTGLIASTNYYFLIKDSEGVSQRFWFRTAPDTNDTMSFISGGDSRNNSIPRQNANRLVAKLKPTAVFFGGDMTNGDSSSEWQDWFDDWQLTIASDGRIFPIIPARGNHEGTNNSIYNLFNVPSTDIYYNITFGANLYSIYTLNSEITAGGSQYSWLQSQLNSDNAIWKSAQYHKPMRPHNSLKSEGNDEYSNWAKLFYDEGVRLVYESDSHMVKTTWPIKPCSNGTNCDEGFQREDLYGTVYVGEGCWGAPLRAANDSKIWTRDAASFNQFKWVCVSSSQIEVKTIAVDNALSVGENLNNAICELPSGIDVWDPDNGGTVTIINSALQAPSITITSLSNGQYIADGTNTTLTANAFDNDGTIDYVDFKVNGVSVGVDNTAPFEIIYSFINGSHELETIAYDNHGLTDNDTVAILVGTFVGELNVLASDDVEQKESNGAVYFDSSDLELVHDFYNFQGNQTIGIRFANLNIPQNATIDNAYIQFTADGSYSNTAEFLVFVEDDDNSNAYQDINYNVTSGRNYFSAVYWSPPAWNDGAAGAAQRTPNLKAYIQNIVNSGNWIPGNAVAVKIEGTGVSLTNTFAKRKAESLDGLAAPVLHIEYTVSPGMLNVSNLKIKKLDLYPNPVTDILYLQLPDEKDKWTIQVFSSSGVFIYESKISKNQVNIAHIKKGVYLINILDEHKNTYYTHKIYKK